MTALERFAILGDHASQDECTLLGIMLPCPFCGGDAWEDHFTANSHNGNTVYRYLCNSCSCGTWWHKHAIDALREWNTRQAPPIGRCGECAEYNTSGFSDGCGWCEEWNVGKSDEWFCDKFKEKESNSK